MNVAIVLAADRVQRSRADVERRLGERLPSRSAASTIANRALEQGVRVFDLVTGEEGEIVGRIRENIIVPAAQ